MPKILAKLLIATIGGRPSGATLRSLQPHLARAEMVIVDEQVDPALLWPCPIEIPIHRRPYGAADFVALLQAFCQSPTSLSTASKAEAPRCPTALWLRTDIAGKDAVDNRDSKIHHPQFEALNAHGVQIEIFRDDSDISDHAEPPNTSDTTYIDPVLQGRRIVLTRSATDNLELAQKLCERGAIPVSIPTLRIINCPRESKWSEQRQQLSDFFGLILSSPRGVEALHEALTLDTQPTAPRSAKDASRTPPPQLQAAISSRIAGLKIAAVGPATAEALRTRGYPVHLQAVEAHSEGMIASLNQKAWLGQSWLHIRGPSGRPLLQDAIHHAHGRYELAIAYKNCPPSLPAIRKSALAAPGQPSQAFDLVYFASGQSVDRFLAILEEQDSPKAVLEWMQRTRSSPPDHAMKAIRPRIVTLGPVTARHLEAQGWKVDAVAQGVDLTSVLAAMQQALLD